MSQNVGEKIKEEIKNFLVYLELEKGRSLNTVKNYEHYLETFFDFGKVQDFSQIDLDLVRNFRLWLNRRDISQKTQNYYLIALRSFLKFLRKKDIKTLAPEKIELAKIPEREIEIISREEFERLIEAPMKENMSLEDIRNKTILELLYSTGLRVSELCSLNDDLNLNADEFTIRGKGNKLRLVFLSDEAKKWIKKYREKLNDKQKIDENALLLTSSGKRIYPRLVQRVIEKMAIKAGIMKNVTPHTIRHYFATDLLQNGADIRSVQMLLGHASINTTQVYTNISDKFLKEVHKKFHGKNKN